MLCKSLKAGLSAVLLALAGSKEYLSGEDIDVLTCLVDAANNVLMEDEARRIWEELDEAEEILLSNELD